MRVRRPRPGFAASAAAMLVCLTVGALPGPSAGAHSGGRAQLYVDSIRLEPQADGWGVALVVRDGDSGQLEPGFGVHVAASGPAGQTVGPVGLADGDNDGHYEGTVPITDGSWMLTVEADEVPGSARAVPSRRPGRSPFRRANPSTWPAPAPRRETTVRALEPSP